MQNWNFYVSNLSSKLLLCALFLLTLPTSISSDCGPYARTFQGYTFVHPGLVDIDAKAAPFFLDFEAIYERYGRQDRMQVNDNLREWHERFCEIPKINDIAYIVYKASIEEIQALLTAIKSENIPISPIMRGNSFALHLERYGCDETLEYLIFAKSCEPYVVDTDAWKGDDRNIPAMRNLIEQGLKAFRRTESHYFRLRYAYQLVRLAHYAGDYERVLELYDYLMPKTDNAPSIIEYWILGHKAGAMMALGQRVEASYLFSLVFDNCLSKRESAYQSFRLKTDEEWEQCQLMCKDDHERSVLYAMRAYNEYSRAVEEMYEIYELQPESDYLEVLLIREIKKVEKQLLGLEYNDHARQNKNYHNIPRKGMNEYIIRLQELVRHIVQEGGTARPVIWKIAEGYLEVIAGDYYAGNRTLQEVRTETRDKFLREQIDAFLLVNRINSFRRLTNEVEESMAAIKLDNALYKKYPDFEDLLHDKALWLYEENDYEGKGYLLKYGLDDLLVNPREDLIRNLMQLTNDQDPNRFERDLIRNNEGESLRNKLVDLEGTRLFAEGNLAAAREIYRQMDRSKWEDFGVWNPFEEHINDCINCATRDSFNLYSRGEIIERLLDLEYQALGDRENGARHYYQIGLAYYNMSYFGYSWETLDYFRSGSSLKRTRYSRQPDLVYHVSWPDGNRENFDCSKALEYFEKARLTARTPELAAAATFMAAKCEQNRYFAYKGPRTYRYFEILKQEYSNTDVYNRLIEECKYFRAYIAK